MNKIEIGGQKRPIRFSYLALKEICADCKLKLNQIGDLGSEVFHIGIIAYYGLKYGAKKQGDEFKYKVKDIEHWLDNEDFSKVSEVFDAFKLDQPKSEGK